MLEIELLSLFPSYLDSPLKESILKRALQKGLLKVTSFDIRTYSKEPHQRVDDRPFGGGPGMVMRPDVVSSAIRDKRRSSSRVIYLSPQGKPFTSQIARELAQEEHLLLLSGHYEGVDQRVLDEEVDLELSIGDCVLTNGCLAALVVIDAVARFVPGVLGNEEAAEQDSFEDGLLDCSHYTKPLSFHGVEVPEVLRGGDHARIGLWRKAQQVQKTYLVRPDLLSKLTHDGVTLFSRDISSLRKWYKGLTSLQDLPDLLGFSCFFGSLRMNFLPSEEVSSGIFTIRLPKDSYSHLYQKVKRLRISDISDRFALQDPEGRVLVFLQAD